MTLIDTSLAPTRLRFILSLVQAEGSVRTRELAEQVGVSEITIRRDLSELEKLGYLKRIHGGATIAPLDFLKHTSREKQHLREKRLVAFKALEFIPNRGTIYLDAGTTSVEIAKALGNIPAEHRSKIRVVTHAINVAAYLAETQVIGKIYQVGGDLDLVSLAATGPNALEQVAKLNFDVFFMGVSGADRETGWSNNDSSEAEIKRVVMQRAARTYVVADSSKWGTIGFVPIAPLTAVAGWIIDQEGGIQINRDLDGVDLQFHFANQ